MSITNVFSTDIKGKAFKPGVKVEQADHMASKKNKGTVSRRVWSLFSLNNMRWFLSSASSCETDEVAPSCPLCNQPSMRSHCSPNLSLTLSMALLWLLLSLSVGPSATHLINIVILIKNNNNSWNFKLFIIHTSCIQLRQLLIWVTKTCFVTYFSKVNCLKTP